MDSVEDELREVVDGAFVSSYSMCALQVLKYLMAVLIVSIIGSVGYGILATIQRVTNSLRVFFTGAFSGLKRTVPRKDETQKNTVILSSIIVMGTLLAVISLSIFYFREIVESRILQSKDPILLYGVVLLFLANTLVIYAGEIFKSYKRIPQFNAIARWISPILQISAIFISSLLFPNTLKTVIYSISSGLFLTFFVSILILLIYTSCNPLRSNLDKGVISEYLFYVIVATMATLFSGVQSIVPNIMMIEIPAEQAGVFGIGLIIATLARIPLGSINQIFPQVAAELHENGKMQELSYMFKKTSKMAVFFSLPMSFFFMVFHNEIAVFVSPDYAPYSVVIPIMVVGQLAAVMVGSVGLLILMTDNHRKIVPVEFILMITTVLITYYMTVEFGVMGLSIGYAVSYSLNNIIELLFLYNRESMISVTWDHILMITTLLAFSCAYYFLIGPLIPFLPLELLISVFMCVLLMGLNYRLFMDKFERRVIAEKTLDLVDTDL